MSEVTFNNIAGNLASGGMTSITTTIPFAAIPPLPTISSANYAKVEIDPGLTTYEIVYLSPYTSGATTGTVLRGQEETSAVAHAGGAVWVHGPTAADFAGGAAGGAFFNNGIFVPPGWGANSQAAAAAALAGAGLFTACVLGASGGAGMYSADLFSSVSGVGCYTQIIKGWLQAALGNGGSGFMSAFYGNTMLWWTAGGGAGSYYGASNLGVGNTSGLGCQISGSWANGGSSSGPNFTFADSSTNTDTATFYVNGRYLDVLTLRTASVAYSAYKYQIDGGSVITVGGGTAGGTSTTQIDTVDMGTTGNHTVVITSQGSSSPHFFLAGVSARNATGAVLHRFAKGGLATGTVVAGSNYNGLPYSGSAGFPGQVTGQPNLLIFNHGVNDAYGATSADTFIAHTRTILNNYLDVAASSPMVAGAGTTDILFLLNHPMAFDTSSLYQDYADRMFGLAQGYNAALVNMWTLGKNSYQWMLGQNYVGNASNPATHGTDYPHMSPAGHAWQAGVIRPVLDLIAPGI